MRCTRPGLSYSQTRNAIIWQWGSISHNNSNLRHDTSVSDAWDVYWKGARGAAAPIDGGVRNPVVRNFWVDRLSSLLRENPEMAILDIASGDGAILDILSSIDDRIADKVTCVDSSPAAIDSIGSRFPAATGVIADAAAIPLDDNGFALVTSQFGVEYAGTDAIDEAARLVAPDGRMILLMHMAGSLMHRECEAALDAIRATEESGFIPLALSMFECGFAAVRGADRRAYDAAAARLNPAVRQIENTIGRYGENVAGGTISALYSGVATIHAEIQHYEPQPVLDWLHIMKEEMTSFAGRMQSMNRAALSEAEYSKIRRRIQDRGYTVDLNDRLSDFSGTPLGWLVIAQANS